MDDNLIHNLIGCPISVEEANQYIMTHIETVHNSGQYPIKSFIFNAEMLRNYLNERPEIRNLKFMLGVRPDVAGVNNNTMVIVGYDAMGNYIKTADNMVLDHAGACPHTCPLIGDAQNDLIT